MKKTIIIFLILFYSVVSFAQLEVKEGSFKEVSGFVNINPDPDYQTDDNDLLFAVIKVRTENISDKQRRELYFEGNAGTFINLEYKIGEVWVYLTAKYANYLKISHPDLSSIEFALPCDLQPKKGYELTLVNRLGMAPEKEVYNYLVVTADQPNAAVYIDDVFEGKQMAQKSFRGGEKHSWRIECELFHAESGEAIIPDMEENNVMIDKILRPAYGYIEVTSIPESGAIVYIDGKEMGHTPYTTDKLASGNHSVKVVMAMYSVTEGVFTVTDGNTTNAQMGMAANFVRVTITTDAEADIFVDNEKKSTGSWTGRLSDGMHSLEARKTSHKTIVQNVFLTLGKDEDIVIPNPTPIFGTLDVSTNPIGASIIIDGELFGTTPRVLSNVIVGDHTLVLEKDGYRKVSKTINISEQKIININEVLQKDDNVTYYTIGDNIAIFFNDIYYGILPLDAQKMEELGLSQDYNIGDDFVVIKTKAEHGDAAAQNNLGQCYLKGKGVEKDEELAYYWFKKSAENNNATGQVNLARCYQNGWGGEVNYDEALKWATKATEVKNAAAYNFIGVCYIQGLGVTQDHKEAIKWFIKAVDQEFALAQTNLGDCYFNGSGVAQDYAESVKWYRKAADQGFARAQTNIGNCYYNGKGVTQDYTEAVKWYSKAANQGDANAQANLGICYYNGQGVVQDYKEAVKWYRKAADQGNANAQNNIGNCYYNGKGVTQDYAEAVKWYRKSANQGNTLAESMLGVCYYDGQGVTQDYKEAVKWFRKAADLGLAGIQSILGDCYYYGKGVAQDYKEAVKWYRKAADQGDANAQTNLGTCYHNGQGVAQDYKEAVKWYRKAADQGIPLAEVKLGVCYYLGQGVDLNYDTAKMWFKKSADHGNESAKDLLKKMP